MILRAAARSTISMRLALRCPPLGAVHKVETGTARAFPGDAGPSFAPRCCFELVNEAL